MNYVLIENNFLTNEECLFLINYFKNKVNPDTQTNGVNYAWFEQTDYINLNFLQNKIPLICEKYINTFKEIQFTEDKWTLNEFRFKMFKPGNFFQKWHSEHCLESPNRIFNFMIYLSTHNCGTEFFDGTVIKSETGKAIIFPAYFTHTHRGQVCPDNKERFLLGGYANFVE